MARRLPAARLKLFGALRAGLSPILKAVTAAEQPRADFLAREYPIDRQHAFSRCAWAELIGYDLNRGGSLDNHRPSV